MPKLIVPNRSMIEKDLSLRDTYLTLTSVKFLHSWSPLMFHSSCRLSLRTRTGVILLALIASGSFFGRAGICTAGDSVVFGRPIFVVAVAFSSDGKHLAGASLDKSVKVWD